MPSVSVICQANGKMCWSNIVYDRLLSAFGPQYWWPGDTRFEVIVGAVLTQNTAWSNVCLALDNLRAARAMSMQAMQALSFDQLAALIRPAGYYRVKARRLQNVLEFLAERFSSSLDEMFRSELADLREQLLSVNGIGPETADSILLYAGQMPTFVVDAYTARVVKRHHWIDPAAGYYEIKELFETRMEPRVELFNEYHALLVRLGKDYCRPRPRCDGCPLEDLLPCDLTDDRTRLG